MIKANDTDVVVIAISTLPLLKQYGLQKLWICYGQAAHLMWILLHDLVSSIGQQVDFCSSMQACTICGVVSAFCGKGINRHCNVCSEVTSVFSQLVSIY